MKTVFLLILVWMNLFASPYQVGQAIDTMQLQDQFGKSHVMKTFPATMMVAFDRESAAMVNDYLSTQPKGYLEAHKTVFIADISQMPSFIAEAFALPKMRKYNYEVLLIKDEALSVKLPFEENKISVISTDGKKITKIIYASSAAEIQGSIEP